MNKRSAFYLLLFISLLLCIGFLGDSDKNVTAQVKNNSNANMAPKVNGGSFDFGTQSNKAYQKRSAQSAIFRPIP